MFKAFAAALAPAIALGRGAENGTDSGNAYSVELVNTNNARLSLNVWNVRDETEGWQVHGDLTISVINGPPTVKTNVCIEIPGAPEKRWDCMVAIADKLDASYTLAFVDQHMYGPTNTMTLEDSDAESPSAKWLRGPARHSADCSPGSVAGKLTCQITVPFHRNFGTGDSTNDLQLTVDDSSKNYIATGWLELLDVANRGRSDVGSVAESQKTIKLVSSLAIQIDENNSKNNGGETNGGDGTIEEVVDPNPDRFDDGASSMTTMAVAIAAAISAVAF